MPHRPLFVPAPTTALRRAVVPMLALILAICASAGGDVRAQDREPTILTIQGVLGGIEGTDSVAFGYADLKALPQREIRDDNPWEPGRPAFSGPTLSDVLALVGAQGTVLEMVAINDYRVEIPLGDADLYEPILALDRNGTPMQVRDKGPVWLIYPAAAADDLGQDTMEARMIWQLAEIVVR